ncbi:hypothetical protein HK107_03910 [Parvularcula sp. ZS-1/3]|uniref:PEP-CTERM sorting domain-containing protein n=1 Tax=Parvularcula mediterranea TaxID=2732508 RepID=A0A7Y3RKT1_9PROT|nr:hypothetical protein [Parvularcula mediterranea]NNU15465.1 hypothetical protein [Parvularcula mediterranea]
MNMFYRTFSSFVSLALSSFASASAATIWDEAIDGDLARLPPGTDLGSITEPGSVIVGSLSAGPTGTQPVIDEFDFFAFTTDGSLEIAITYVTGTAQAFNNVSSLAITFPAFGPPLQIVPIGQTFVYSPSDFDFANSLSIGLLPFANAGDAVYRVEFRPETPIPAPGAALLLLSGLALTTGRRLTARPKN